jgi:hypothetical protein
MYLRLILSLKCKALTVWTLLQSTHVFPSADLQLFLAIRCTALYTILLLPLAMQADKHCDTFEAHITDYYPSGRVATKPNPDVQTVDVCRSRRKWTILYVLPQDKCLITTKLQDREQCFLTMSLTAAGLCPVLRWSWLSQSYRIGNTAFWTCLLNQQACVLCWGSLDYHNVKR